jgi:hypothetical protein
MGRDAIAWNRYSLWYRIADRLDWSGGLSGLPALLVICHDESDLKCAMQAKIEADPKSSDLPECQS